MKFKITNGLLFDPIQNFDKKKKDIFVDGNKIVDPSSEEKKKYITSYDVDGMIVMAGAIDMHSHIAGGNVNNARLLMPEIHKMFVENILKSRKNNPSTV